MQPEAPNNSNNNVATKLGVIGRVLETDFGIHSDVNILNTKVITKHRSGRDFYYRVNEEGRNVRIPRGTYAVIQAYQRGYDEKADVMQNAETATDSGIFGGYEESRTKLLEEFGDSSKDAEHTRRVSLASQIGKIPVKSQAFRKVLDKAGERIDQAVNIFKLHTGASENEQIRRSEANILTAYDLGRIGAIANFYPVKDTPKPEPLPGPISAEEWLRQADELALFNRSSHEEPYLNVAGSIAVDDILPPINDENAAVHYYR